MNFVSRCVKDMKFILFQFSSMYHFIETRLGFFYCMSAFWCFYVAAQTQSEFKIQIMPLKSKSIRNKGKGTIGDDLCLFLKNVGKMRRLPGAGRPTFPEGLLDFITMPVHIQLGTIQK